MARPVVLAAWQPQEPEEANAAERILGGRAELHWWHELRPDLRRDLLPRVEVLLVFGWPETLTGELPRMRSLRLVQRFVAGVETLPFPALARRKPRPLVAGGSGSNANAVAEHAWALVLACAKRVALHDRALRASGFEVEETPSVELRGRTLGLLGYGAVGRRVEQLGRAFGMRVLALRKHARGRTRAPVIGTVAQLPRLLRESDVVVVALPLTPQTERLLDRRALARLRPDAILVNVARGPILDEAAAFEYLALHPRAHWGLDVWWQYREGRRVARPRHAFASLPNVVMTPHTAAFVPGFRAEMVEFGCRNAARFLSGRRPKNVVDYADYLTRGPR